jgi:signal peptidase I
MPGKNKPSQRNAETRLEGFASFCGVFVTGLFVLTFVFQNFAIPSSSMASTLQVGDHVVAEREILVPRSHFFPLIPYRDVQRDDIVVFYKPVPEEDGHHMTLVKRVIAVPGDRIHLRNGIVYLNDIAQHETYAAKPTASSYNPYVDDFPSIPPVDIPGVTATWAISLREHLQGDDIVVPPGQFFVMGDNRDRSLDSRFWGFVPRENIIGRPLFVYWSFEQPETGELSPSLQAQFGLAADELVHFFDKTRWNRTLHRVQ